MNTNVDLDIVVYKVGAACDNKHYVYKGQRWDRKAVLNRQLKRDGVDDSAVTIDRDPETWANTKKSLTLYLEGSILQKVGGDYQGWLSGNSNFRYNVATVLPYKGNRAKYVKPFHYDRIRQFLVDVYKAKLSENMEADDAIGLAHDPERDCIATTDKDLDCIPGLHYNWDRDHCYWVTEVEANRNFFKQLLIGDPTDNILGLYNVGAKSEFCKRVDRMECVDDMRDLVVTEYSKRFGNRMNIFYEENALLLWIRQQREMPIELQLLESPY